MKKLYERLAVTFILSTILIMALFVVSLYERGRKANEQYLDQLLSGVETNLKSVRLDYEEKVRLLEEDYLNRARAVDYILSSDSQMISEAELAIVKELMEVRGIAVTDREGNVCLSAGEQSGPRDAYGLVWPDGSRVVIEDAGFYEAPSYFYVETESTSQLYGSVRLDARVDRLDLISREEMVRSTLLQATTEEDTILAAVEKENGRIAGITRNNVQELQVDGVETSRELLELLEEIQKEGRRILKVNGESYMVLVREQEGTYLLALGRMKQIVDTAARTLGEGLAGIAAVSLLTVLLIHFHLKKYLFGQVSRMRGEIQQILEGGSGEQEAVCDPGQIEELKPLAETIRRLGRDHIEKREGMSRMEDQLTEAQTEARYDQLTGLYNRSGFERCTEEFLSRDDPAGVLVLFDLDNFKRVNDYEGHPQGDQILVRFAKCLRASFRKSDYIGRLGGDEFTVLMPNRIGREMLEQKFRGLLEQVRLALGPYYEKYQVSVSIGAVWVDGEIRSYEGLYQCADTALYIAKYLGKDQYYINDRKISCMRRECIGCREDCPRSRILKQNNGKGAE